MDDPDGAAVAATTGGALPRALMLVEAHLRRYSVNGGAETPSWDGRGSRSSGSADEPPLLALPAPAARPGPADAGSSSSSSSTAAAAPGRALSDVKPAFVLIVYNLAKVSACACGPLGARRQIAAAPPGN